MGVDLVLRPLHDPRWSAFVAAHGSALPFHHPSWAAMLAECYRFRAFFLTIDDQAGRILAGLPVVEVHRRGRPRWVSLPFTDECPPLVTAGAGENLSRSLDELRRAFGMCRFEVRAELRGEGMQRGDAFLSHRLPLDRSEDDVFAALHANQVRRNIRRAQRAGVVVRPGNAEADVTEVFYRLHTRTRHRLGVPVQPLRYFRLLWEAIRWAMARGCRTFDFGRTDLADNGLREFKARWGTVEREFSCSVLADAPARAGVGGVPSPLRSAIRRGPMFVPRVLGELLYRHTA